MVTINPKKEGKLTFFLVIQIRDAFITPHNETNIFLPHQIIFSSFSFNIYR
jgi:hypothetical protein